MGILGLIKKGIDTARNYSDVLKVGTAALSTYASFKDQQKKNQMQQDAYDDYMAQAEAAGHEARAAIDVNYTPMTVSGVPTTTADVTDFTAVAARGGLMSIPNKQRKRYARGPDEVDVMEMDEEVITPEGFKMETGVDVTGEQVFHDTGNPRTNARNVWTSGAINQEIYELDFEIFFQSGDWMDHISQAPAPTGDMQMASHEGNDAFLENRYQELLEMNLSPAEAAAQAEKELSSGNVPGPMATGGIAGLRKGYDIGDIVTADTEAVVSEVPPERKNQIEDSLELNRAYQQIYAQFLEKFPNIDTDTMRIEDMIAMLQAEGVRGTEGGGILSMKEGLDMITPESVDKSVQRISRGDTQYEDIPEEIFTSYEDYNKGGRAGYRLGDEVVADTSGIGITSLPRPAMDPRGFRSLPAMATKEGMMDLGGMEKDYRFDGGFVPIGAYEKKDDVPARLSKNEFVFTADAVRAAGGGSINKGAQRMYDTMKNLEARPTAKRMTA